jgi:hypothetical protein
MRAFSELTFQVAMRIAPMMAPRRLAGAPRPGGRAYSPSTITSAPLMFSWTLQTKR